MVISQKTNVRFPIGVLLAAFLSVLYWFNTRLTAVEAIANEPAAETMRSLSRIEQHVMRIEDHLMGSKNAPSDSTVD